MCLNFEVQRWTSLIGCEPPNQTRVCSPVPTIDSVVYNYQTKETGIEGQVQMPQA